MLPLICPLLFVTRLMITASASDHTTNFVFNGFASANLLLDGMATVTSTGLLQLTEPTDQDMGHAFYPYPLPFKNASSAAALSFSTSFVFAIVPRYPDLTGHGIAFVLSASSDLTPALPSQYIGLFNKSDQGKLSNHLIAVEFDTNYSPEFDDINNNHVGIDVNSLRSVYSASASYFSDGVGTQNLTLASGNLFQAWVEYDQFECLLNVTLAPLELKKPSVPLLSSFVNLSSFITDYMHIGFSSAVGSFPASHYLFGWSFALNGRDVAIDISLLPRLPIIITTPKSKLLIKYGLPAIGGAMLVVAGFATCAFILIRKKIKFAELLEDWEQEHGPQRFSYKDLYIATKGFGEKEFLGAGGFGRVYKGVLPRTKTHVAVKKISHETRHGMRQFVAEIISIGHLRHQNLVQLLGYCRRKGELLLVYDFMPNGSLDRFLFDKPESMLDWKQRLHIIKGVASGLFHLHEEWDQVVIHRDIKASNVLLDSQMNGRLGDFGLSRLYDHGSDPQTTHVVGTLGYLAPELTRTGKATTSTDVYAFGGFLLEMACGRGPVETKALPEKMILVDWVHENWRKGSILDIRDPNLEEFSAVEMELVLKLGLLCSHPKPSCRPRMRLVMQVLDGDAALPEELLADWNESFAVGNDGFADLINLVESAFSKSVVSLTESTGKKTER
ncbi:L-type lectin-domain containing receptor kinase IV.2-like [Phalaenopsis equestris]|uniref:L-type lectin-domain containing receptor kinase IV.2-like n=1 Tax=Phalaenopsis equestris TaxID=78828 RepID=UPI0009E2DB9B|nr:L-type lectin-domain containing receptor kinase IV.2-like [Phalaenopsis equestris]